LFVTPLDTLESLYSYAGLLALMLSLDWYDDYGGDGIYVFIQMELARHFFSACVCIFCSSVNTAILPTAMGFSSCMLHGVLNA
jgi:hypothetical protein